MGRGEAPHNSSSALVTAPSRTAFTHYFLTIFLSYSHMTSLKGYGSSLALDPYLPIKSCSSWREGLDWRPWRTLQKGLAKLGTFRCPANVSGWWVLCTKWISSSVFEVFLS
jgi:hypothetical protein